MNPYGSFDDSRREYVIHRPDTPLPWINYLGSEDFLGIISNTAGGYCFYRDPRLRRLLRYRYNDCPLDSNGRYLYVKDGQTVWNPSWKPVRTDLDAYECRHGLGYTRIRGEKNGLAVEMTCFIPPGRKVEVWLVEVENQADGPRDVQLFSFVEWCLWDAWDDATNFQRNYSTGQVEVEDSAIFHVTEYRERRNHFAYFAAMTDIAGFDTSRDAFVGACRGLADPQAVEQGACTGSIAHGWQPIGAHQIDLHLEGGEKKQMHFLLGYAENAPEEKWQSPGVVNKAPFRKVQEELGSFSQAQEAFEDLGRYWDELLGTFQVEIDNPHLQRMVNVWNTYQCMTTFNLSRSASLFESGIGRGMGYRDSNQDILGFVHLIAPRARQRILDIAATQLADGTCYHQYQPLTKKGNSDIGGGFNDDPLWPHLATGAYIRETGDLSILDEQIGYADQPDSKATLLDHLELSVDYTLNNLGPHGLPLIGHADWNDCLNLNCFSTTPGESFQLAGDIGQSQAESTMIAGLFCAAADEMSWIYRSLAREKDARRLSDQADNMRQALTSAGWGGKWFLRAYDAAGNPVGSDRCQEGKIFIEPQGWAVLGGAGLESGQALQALDSVAEHLSTRFGVVLQQPAYSTYHVELGEITSYPPGYKENAGIFTHNNTWIQIAEALLGRGDRAMEYYLSICPSTKEACIDTYRAEPYVYSQMTAGPDAPTFGEGKNSWLTGTAAWSFVSATQYILGIRPDFDGLRIHPCLPQDCPGYKAQRVFRGKTYRIQVSKPAGICAGRVKLTVDGQRIDGDVIPARMGSETVEVVAEIQPD